MYVLGIESTCDETGASIVENGRKILSNVVASSTDIHVRYGGVFPELASRRHLEAIQPVVEEAMAKANLTAAEIDLIAVARGPGLIGSLLVGLQFAKGLALAWNKPWIGVNHIEAHLYAAMMAAPEPLPFPALGLVLSGGHTLLIKINAVGDYERVGTTVDDAIGEAFDKVAALLQLPYPGGPHLETLAKQGNPHRFSLAAGKVKKSPLDFSFSGLKTSVLYALKGQNATSEKYFTPQDRADLAASFQETALRDCVDKAKLAQKQLACRSIFLGGGVCNNQRLQELFREAFPDIPLYFPSFALTMDNAAMIAGLGYEKFLINPVSDSFDLEAITRIPIA
ncbi:MAG TPA: tRNA (adenosine(37)-N6)-threonylcarbamoyltransferase complex transferase subunit TsaD [Chlamydiales bacterium]|jgi:N6-L-threonylcarbamoyladenine synthase|nr:tRNA (adenosine(37)-N6)-threonylcarbamoyltransferase complex transferase subunit TsaD [Chlamydiales bacterium]